MLAPDQILGIPEIHEFQRNRFPLLLIDRVASCQPVERVEAIKNFTYNEWYFPAHFPDNPNVPGFVQLECLAQAFILTFLTLPGLAGKETAFVELKEAEFKRKIVPGDQLQVLAKLESFRRGIASGSAASFVNGEPACRASLVVAVPDVLNRYLPHTK